MAPFTRLARTRAASDAEAVQERERLPKPRTPWQGKGGGGGSRFLPERSPYRTASPGGGRSRSDRQRRGRSSEKVNRGEDDRRSPPAEAVRPDEQRQADRQSGGAETPLFAGNQRFGSYRNDYSQNKGGKGGLGKGNKGMPRQNQEVPGMQDFHIQDENTAWALGIMSKSVAVLHRRDRLKQALLYDAVEGDNVWEEVVAALKEKDRWLQAKDNNELDSEAGSLGFNMGWAFTTAVATSRREIGGATRTQLNRELEKLDELSTLEAETAISDLIVEKVVSNTSRSRILIACKQWAGRRPLLDALHQLGFVVFRGPAPPGYLEKASSAIASALER